MIVAPGPRFLGWLVLEAGTSRRLRFASGRDLCRSADMDEGSVGNAIGWAVKEDLATALFAGDGSIEIILAPLVRRIADGIQ